MGKKVAVKKNSNIRRINKDLLTQLDEIDSDTNSAINSLFAKVTVLEAELVLSNEKIKIADKYKIDYATIKDIVDSSISEAVRGRM